MSLARVHVTKKVRKDWTCGKCGTAIREGVDGRISFAVGFRGREQTRCLKTECYPTPSERESSAVAMVYAAQEEVDLSTVDSTDDFYSVRDDVVSACEEVAQEYEDNEMFEINEDLQERAEILRSAANELTCWEPENEEPDSREPETWGDHESFNDAMEAWLDETRESLQTAIDEMELP